ncbi:MAG: CDP-glycerol glycerophosphotransferase family protein [Proteobacteria bacterium]|nr:CDP-glycerol glycerophosphotransferase family protein [Pseudomonadota bacterium]
MNKKYKIGYYIVTDIQHIPPVVRLYPHLGGIVFTNNREVYDFLKTKYIHMNLDVYFSESRSDIHRAIVQRGIRVMIYPSYHMLFRGKAVEIFHGGLSDKNYVESLKILGYDLVLFPGEKTKDKVEESGYLKSIPEWHIVGYPKFDPLINNTLDYTPIFNNSKKTILYAPTWISQNASFKIVKFSRYGESSLELWGKEIITKLHKDYNLIVKYHSRIYRKKGDIYDQIEELIGELDAESCVKVIYDDNILPYMAQSDIMISDISTACYEWFHFNRPMIFANPSPDHYRISKDIRSNTYAWQAGDVISKSEDILKNVKDNLAFDKYGEIRNQIFHYTVYKPDGQATERQAQAIVDFYKRYENIPYLWLIFSSYIFRRWRRSLMKIKNTYYKYFNKEKIGK